MPDIENDKQTGEEFEASVRQVARQLFSNANLTGSIKIDGRERDEIVDTGTELIAVEATKSRKLDKIQSDLKKSVELVKSLRHSSEHPDYNLNSTCDIRRSNGGSKMHMLSRSSRLVPGKSSPSPLSSLDCLTRGTISECVEITHLVAFKTQSTISTFGFCI